MAQFTYTYPVSGTTPPTAAQMLNASMIVGTLAMADADTQLVITHNMSVPQADQSALFPLITHELSACSTTFPGGPTFTLPAASSTPANTVTAGKASANAGTGFTATVTIQRPHTLIR